MVSCLKCVQFLKSLFLLPHVSLYLLYPLPGFSPLITESAKPPVRTPPEVNFHHSECGAPLFTLENAGFQQCVSKLTNYMQKITQSQRASLLEGLKRHAVSLQPNDTTPDFSQRGPESEVAKQMTPVEFTHTSERKEECLKLLFPSHSPFHPCSTPCHDFVSPPPSPWLSSLNPYASSPPFWSFASHFSSPNSLSPLSSNTSFFSFSSTTLQSSPALHCPPLTTLRCPPLPAQTEGSSPNSSSPMWRPWF